MSGTGVAGVMAPSFGREFWLATIVVFSVFMLGAAVGHIRSMPTTPRSKSSSR